MTMTLEEARNEFTAAAVEFETLIAGTPVPASNDTTFWSRLKTLAMSVLGTVAPMSAGLTMRTAMQAVVATHSVIKKLADATGNAVELERYARVMRGLTAEYTALAEKVLDQSEAKYAPIAERFKSAAASLKEAYQKAEQLASSLNLGADLLNAFGKLVSVL